MKNTLMVPVHLDALYLARDRLLVEAMADFSRLPYFDGVRDVNSNIANISEEIVSQPFQNQNLYLKSGIHLHWALPDVLTKGIQVSNENGQTQTAFPPVPNRWLVTRSREETIETQWVVESDYLYPEGEGSQVGSIAYPIEVQKDKHQPFRYLGRKVPLADWQEDQVDAKYLPSLTAVGYGEPTFAAFYPNCHSVFGFHDDDYAAEIPGGLQYDIIGWYSEPQQTCLQEFLEKLRNTLKQQGHETPINNQKLTEEFKWKVIEANQEFIETLRNTLKQQGHQTPIKDQKLIEEFKWKVIEANQELPESLRFICYARLNFSQDNNTNTGNSNQQASVEVTVGNTGTEALSAYLGEQIDRDRKSIIEDQLEALHLSSRLEHRQLDMTPKFKEARHEKGFNAIAAGTMWTIRSESLASSTTANAENAHNQAQLTLPDDMARLLNELNLNQQKYDCALHEIESMRRQLFSDWYKYMLSAYPPEGSKDQYPDIDEVKHYIEVKGIAPLEAKLTATGNLMLLGENSGKITAASAREHSSTSTASQLATAINQLLFGYDFYLLAIAKLLNNQHFRLLIFYFHTLVQQRQKAKATYSLRQISSPRYWQPKEPVLLMTGEAVKPTPRHGQDGRLREDGCLKCQFFLVSNDVTTSINKDSLPTIRNKIDKIESNKIYEIESNIDEIEKSQTGENIAFSSWEQQPWHPFLLEWEVEIFPIREGSNHITHNSNYDNKFITNNYILKENEADLSVQSGKGAIVKAANIYSGRSILTPHAGIKLKEQLKVYLGKQILPKYYEVKDIAKNQQGDDYLSNKDNLQSLKQWYEETSATQLDTAENRAKDPIYTAIRAYQNLLTLNCLSQSLGGFNEALLMHKQTMQLPIADPLAFADYQPFTKSVRDIVQQSIRSAPEPLNDFNPIRSGAMKILRLRLVDTFGQVKDLDVSSIITTEQMETPESPYLVTLPPRLVQPARLNFRWLSASQGEQEMNSHPATTPICGWILPNNLDNSLAIYDNQGKALGSINQLAQWEPAPGSDPKIYPSDISNLYLRRVVNYFSLAKHEVDLSQRKQDSLQNFISALDSGLENIDPENFAQHQGLALLMGRPIAVVRASLNLELQGLPAINQDWDMFWHDLRQNGRETDGFEQVKIPIRLGEYKQFNDGLIGYWMEDEDVLDKKDVLSDNFYASQSDSDTIGDSDTIKGHQIKFHPLDNPWHIDLALKDAPQMFTMLIDPRGKVHATCGILPTKTIDIPPDQYQQALEKIEITFLSTPILTDLIALSDLTSLAKKINLSLPVEAGYEWSWLEQENGEWLATSADNIGQFNPNAVFSGKQAIREGLLKLSPAKNTQNLNSQATTGK